MENDQGRKKEVDMTRNMIEQSRMMSKSLDQIVDDTRFFQDLINIQIHQYHQASIPPPFVSTNARTNMEYVFITPRANTSVLITSQC